MKWILTCKQAPRCSKTNASVRVSRRLISFLKCHIVLHSMAPIFVSWHLNMCFVLGRGYPESSFVTFSPQRPWASWAGKQKGVLTQPQTPSHLFITCLFSPPFWATEGPPHNRPAFACQEIEEKHPYRSPLPSSLEPISLTFFVSSSLSPFFSSLLFVFHSDA